MGSFSRTDVAEEGLPGLEGIAIQMFRIEKAKRKMTEKMEQNVQELWDNYKRCNMRIMGMSEIEEKEKETEIFRAAVS